MRCAKKCQINFNLTIVDEIPDVVAYGFTVVDVLAPELSLSIGGTIRSVFESNIICKPVSSLSKKTRRRILSRLNSGGTHCLVYEKRKSTAL